MATVEEEETAGDADAEAATGSTTGRVRDVLTRVRSDRLALAVFGVAAAALVARFLFLGERIAHWDEARVGWWILQYVETGTYEYRPIIHGPFYHHVNRALFGLFGISDFTMRIAVATIGGLAPLTALGLRHRLDDIEVVGVALFLAANPILLYYTRFMRGDGIVGLSMFVAFVAFVRFVDFRRARYLYAGVTAAALAFTAKENAFLYPLTWAGALVLLLDHRLFLARGREQEWTAVAKTAVGRAARGVWAWLHHILFAALWFLVIIVFFYAPRSADPNELGLYNALRDPTTFPAVVHGATVGSWESFYSLWVAGDLTENPYLPYLTHYLETLAYGALAVCVLAVVGFVVDRYSGERPRDLVSFSFYCGFVSVLGYPMVTDIQAPWATVHAVVPLVIPAAVGLGLIVRWGRTALTEEDPVGVGVAGVLLLVVVGLVAGAILWGVYLNPQSSDNQLVQYAQPGDDIRPGLDRMAAAAADNEGTDVVLYGSYFVRDGVPDPPPDQQPVCAKWFNSLPLPWYFSASDAAVDCAGNRSQLQAAAEDEPPVVIVEAHDDDDEEGGRNYEAIARQEFPEYWSVTYRLRTFGTETVFLIHPDYANQDAKGTRNAG